MKYLMLLVLVYPNFCWSSDFSKQSPVHSDELTRLLQAKSVNELRAETEFAENIRVKRENCAAELDLKVLPRSCFAVRRLEAKKIEGWLALECEKRAKNSTSRLDLALASADSRGDLPEKCLKAIDERLADLDYLDPVPGQWNGK